MAEEEILTLDEAKKASLTKAFGDKADEMVSIIEDLDKANWEAYNEKVKRQKVVFERRNALVKTIPGFWLKAMTNSNVFSHHIDPIDRDALSHLTEIVLDHDTTDSRSFSVSFHFSQDNPYFSDRVLTKKYTVKPPPEGQAASWDLDAPLSTEAVTINWASPEHDLTKKKPRINIEELEEFDEFEGSSGSFFNWFGEDDDTLGIHDLILELYANATEAYAGILGLEEQDSEEEDDDDDDDEDEDPNAVVDLETKSDDGEPKRKKQKK